MSFGYHPWRLIFAVCLILAPAMGASSQGQGGNPSAVPSRFDPSLDYAQVLFVRATRSSTGTWRFDVTVRHDDEGWDHYADAWQVVDPDTGAVIAERVLAHPHENEQPFTRSLGGVQIHPDSRRVLIRAKCNRHGFGGREILVDLDAAKGEGFEVSDRQGAWPDGPPADEP